MNYSFFTFVLLLFVSCNSKQIETTSVVAKDSLEIQQYSGQVLQLNDSAFSYQISKNEKPVIHQKFLPAVQGKMPIRDSLTASKLLQLSLGKINRGQFPPSLSIQEVNNCISN